MSAGKERKKLKRQAGKDPWGSAARGCEKPTAEAKGMLLPPKRGSSARTKPANGKQAGGKVRALPVKPSPSEDPSGDRRTKRHHRRRRLAVLAVLALIVASLVLAGPLKRNLQASSELGARRQELEVEKEKTRELQERRDRALQADFIVRQARRLGYVLRGEIPVILVRESK